jgi:sarcosine oxidase subunit beta
MSKQSDIIVIGGGINGVSIAFHLAKHNLKVTLLEKNFIAGGPTGQSSAIIRQHYSNPVTIRMAHQSLHVWENFSELVGGSIDFTQTGFMVAVTPKDLEGLKANLKLQEAAGVNTHFVPVEDISDLEPHADKAGLGGAAYEPDSGYCDPASAANGFATAARLLGTKIRTGVAVTGFDIQSGKVVAVETTQGKVSAGAVIVACGPWTPRLLYTLGVQIPISIARVNTILYQPPDDLELRHTWADFTSQVYFRPESGHLILVGSISPEEANDQVADPDNYNDKVPLEIAAEFAEKVANRFLAMDRSFLTSSYASLYDITPDWHPVLDAVPGYEGVYVCAGSSGHGFKLAPAVGKMMARLILHGKDPHEDINLFSFDRFERQEFVHGQYEYSILG